MSKVNTKISAFGLNFANPVNTASGTFGYGLEFAEHMDLNRLGGICTKGLHLNPVHGNPTPRIYETAAGMLNAIGLQNVGLDVFEQEKLPPLKNLSPKVIANFYGYSVAEYIEAAERLDAMDGVDALEMNISCPNIKEGGIQFGNSRTLAAEVVKACRKMVKKPLLVKMSPNIADVAEMAKTLEGAGADGISAVNTFMGMAVDLDRRKPILANVTGGLSGPAIKPLALRVVWQISQAVSIPVMGIGGIMTGRDALEYMICGASLVQVGTANFLDPRAAERILDEMITWCEENQVERMTDLIGTLEANK